MRTQPAENIDVVLGRFQAWAGSRMAVDAKTGVREFSDEEALRSSRYRWKGNEQAPVKKCAEPAKKAAAGKNVAKRASERRSQSAPKCAPLAKAGSKIAPAFGDALARAIHPAEVSAPARPLQARHVAISVRLDAAERALIKTRAAEAGITASAYIRQCALEVEQLRSQVQQAIAAMEHGRRNSAPVSKGGSGFLAWMGQRFLRRRAPALALRT